MSLKTLCLLSLCLLMGACSTHQPKPEEAKTTVYRDGHMAVQVTKLPPDWSGTGKEIVTDCRWDQLTKSLIDGRDYCPPKASKEAYESARHPLVISGNYMTTVIPAASHVAGNVALGGLVMHGLRGAGSTVNQSVSGTQTNIPVFESPGAVIK